MSVSQEVCQYYFEQFNSVSLELETIKGNYYLKLPDAEQVRLDAHALVKFRKRLFGLVREGVMDDTMTLRNALGYVGYLRKADEFKDVKSIALLVRQFHHKVFYSPFLQNSLVQKTEGPRTYGDVWWKKFKEMCRRELEKSDEMTLDAVIENAEEEVTPIEVPTDEFEDEMTDDNDVDPDELRQFEEMVYRMVKHKEDSGEAMSDDELLQAARKLRCPKVYAKYVPNLRMTKAWWKGFKEKFGLAGRIDEVETSDSDSDYDPNDKSTARPMTNPLTGHLNLDEKQQFEIFDFRTKNPDWSFRDISEKFSEKFKAWIKINVKISSN